jgi:hypothetical protein
MAEQHPNDCFQEPSPRPTNEAWSDEELTRWVWNMLQTTFDENSGLPPPHVLEIQGRLFPCPTHSLSLSLC